MSKTGVSEDLRGNDKRTQEYSSFPFDFLRENYPSKKL